MMKTFEILYFITCVLVLGIILVKKYCMAFKHKEGAVNPKEIKTNNEDNADKEDLKYTLESVNSWLNNCDQKAGILLTFIGVAITVIITSDFMKHLRNSIFVPFLQFCLGDSDLSFSWSRFIVFVLLVIAVVSLVTCCVFLFRAISAHIDYGKMYRENPDIVITSYIYYGTISRMTYNDFKKGGVLFEEDLKSQIYVNSKIAMAKFKNYNEGLYWFKLLLLVAIMLFIAIMFMQ